jgi:hypothetical protein
MIAVKSKSNTASKREAPTSPSLLGREQNELNVLDTGKKRRKV